MTNISKTGINGNIELTPHQEFESLIINIINHPFLHYHPYLLDDDKVIEDAEKRAQIFDKIPDTIIEFLDQCCCICHIGDINLEETYISNGDFVKYKTLPIKFYNNKKCQEILLNKSDFNPREYLTVCGFVSYSSNLFLKKSCEKYGTESEKYVKTCSLVNNEAEIEKYQGKTAILAYTIPVASGFGSLRIACRLYTAHEDYAAVIREQILKTKQYVLCTIINFPELITSRKRFFKQDIFEKHLATFKQMYDLVSIEIKERGLEPFVKDEYLPPILDNIDDYFLPKESCESILEDLSEEQQEEYISEYDGMFAIAAYPDCPVEELIDRNHSEFKPYFRNSMVHIDEDDYTEIYYEQIEGEHLIVCYASDTDPEDHYKYEMDDDDNHDFFDNDYEHDFYFDNEYEQDLVNHHYLGLINRYGQTVFELKSISSYRIDRYTHKYGFKTYNDNYIIIYLSDSYNPELNCYTRCGAIDVRKGHVVIPLIYTETEVRRELSHCCIFEDMRYYNPGWIISCYDDDEYFFQGPIYKKGSDILEQGKYAGLTIKDALYFHGKDILYELIFEDKIFIADSVFPRNIALFSPIERSIKLHQDKHLEFSEINEIDDVISTHSWFGYKTEIIYKSLYENKTLREAIEECNGMFYIKSLVECGALKISEDVIDELVSEYSELYSPLKEVWEDRN